MDVTFSILITLLIILILIIATLGYVFINFNKNFLYYINNVLNKKSRYYKSNNYMAEFYDEIYDFLSEMEDRNEIRLSDEAKQLLILPLIEYQKISKRNSRSFNPNENFKEELNSWRESVSKIIETIAFEPARIDKLNTNSILNERTSLSVIKAYSKRFCNIPPFCGER